MYDLKTLPTRDEIMRRVQPRTPEPLQTFVRAGRRGIAFALPKALIPRRLALE